MPKKIIVPATQERWDPVKNEFVLPTKEISFTIEHSLVSIQKWEQIWHKCFLDTKEKTAEEFISYIKCMTIGGRPDDDFYDRLPQETLIAITQYMDEPMTAFHSNKRKGADDFGDKPIAELIYAQMIKLNVPLECAKWHLNSLLALINVCSIQYERANGGNKPTMSRRELAMRNAELNRRRREMLHTRG